MAIQGAQLIYRLKETIRLLIDYRAGVDSFNFYFSSSSGGPFILSLGSIINKASNVPATRGKVVFEFNTTNVIGWNDDIANYVVLMPVVGGVEGAPEGPMTIPTRIETIMPKDYSVMYGFNKTLQKFIPVSVDSDGKMETV
jgi:hypothetical protein